MASSAKQLNPYDISTTFTAGFGKDSKQQGSLQQVQNMTNARMYKFNWDAMKEEQRFNAQQQQLQQDFNSAEAATARDWERYMSDTSHQREVEDLKAAGLNPVLSVNQGANSYTTQAANSGMAQASHASGQGQSAVSGMASLAGSYATSRATKYAANQSAAAMKYSANMAYASAQTSAYAMMYAADRSKEAQVEAAQKHYDATKYSVDYSKDVSFAGLLQNLITGFAQGDENSVGYKILNPIFEQLKEKYKGSTLWEWLGHPKGNTVTASKLNEQGYAHIAEALTEANIACNKATQNALILLLTTNNQKEFNQAMHILENNMKSDGRYNFNWN